MGGCGLSCNTCQSICTENKYYIIGLTVAIALVCWPNQYICSINEN